MDTKIVDLQICLKPTTIFGLPKYPAMSRDKATYAKLIEMGWRVIELWQCQLKPKTKDQTLSNLITELQND